MADDSVIPNLSPRARRVLKALVREHIRTGRPVGSRRLSKIYREGVSPATLRNVMADLEELELVSQPHASAGRVPTPEGYRYYVKRLMEKPRLSGSEEERIRQSLQDEVDPNQMMDKVSHLLSSFSDNVGFVLAPPMAMAVMKHIEFLRTTRGVLVILVTVTGLVQHKLIHLREELDQVQLDQAGRYLVEHFSNRSLVEIRVELRRLISEEKARYDELLRNVMLLGLASLRPRPEGVDSQVFLGGTSRLVQNIDGEELDRLVALFETFEEKNRLVRIITDCLNDKAAGPSVTIGLEQHIPGMGDWTLITSPYRTRGHAAGTLGILGPTRMEYERTIILVDYVAKVFGQILSRN